MVTKGSWTWVAVLGVVAMAAPVWGQTEGVSCTIAASSLPHLVHSNYAALAGDLVVNCTGGTPTPVGSPVPSVTVSVSFSTNYTGRLTGTSTETLLLIDDPDAAHQVPCAEDPGLCGWTGGSPGPNVFAGTMTSATSLSFPNVPLDPPGTNGIRRFRITNIRLDAVHYPIPRPPQVLGLLQAWVTIPGVAASNGAIDVGFVVSDIGAAVLSGSGTMMQDPATGMTLPSCTGATTQRVATLQFGQSTGTEFRTRSEAAFVDDDTSPAPVAQAVLGAAPRSHTGLYNPSFPAALGLNRAGLADTSTRLRAEINGIPDGVTVYVSTLPVTFINGVAVLNGNGQVRARMTSSPSGPFDPVPATTTLEGIPAVALPVVNGTAAAVWEILASPGSSSPYADFLVWVTYPAGTAPAAVTVKTQAAPLSVVNTASETAPVPRFVDDTTARGLFAFRPTCSTGPYFVEMTDSAHSYSVDGIVYKTKQGFNWTPGSTHTLSAIPYKTTDSTYRWVAKPWSDGGPPTHTIVVPEAPVTYLANYGFQVLLSANASPAGAGTIETQPPSADGFFDSDSDIVLTAVPAAGYKFVDFAGALTGTVNPRALHIGLPASVTAEFASTLPMTAADSVAPSAGWFQSGTFRAVYQGVSGAQSLRWAQFLVANAPDGGGWPFCFVHYDVPGNGFWIYSDVYGFFLGPVPPGATSVDLTGSSCALSTALSSVEKTGDLLQMNAHLFLNLLGQKNLYLRAMDQSGFDTGWVQRGTISPFLDGPVSPDVAQETADAAVQTFTLHLTDPEGFRGVQRGWAQFLLAVDSTGGGQPFCFVHFDRAAMMLWMYSSDVGFFLGPVAPGAASTALDSSACTVDTAGSSATILDSGIDLKIKVDLKPTMSGTKQKFTRMMDVLNRQSVWGAHGTYQVP